MANLSIIGSHSINGVSALHSEILKTEVFPLFYRYKPDLFNNKTNGITPRRWLRLANPSLSALITELIGEAWISDLDELTRLRDFAADKVVIDKWRQIKQASKVHFADHLRKLEYGVIDPESIFDFQAKRIHEYKRQLLNALHIISWALKIKAEPGFRPHPHTFFFAGKAAPGYALAKLIIRFINAIAVWIDQDPILAKYLKVVFLSNYRVTLAERIMPAAELSQQISTAGTEASGTGNMKFSLNGALTIGTLDGANIEILQEVGAANFFLFGMTAQEVSQLKATGYNSQDFVESAPYLQDVLQLINSDALSPAEPGLYKPILEALFNFGDRYCIIADFASYASAMQRVNDVYQDTQLWNAMSILNVAGMGKFSSDNTIRQYANEIWNVVSSSH
jgi:starch phosphorylase